MFGFMVYLALDNKLLKVQLLDMREIPTSDLMMDINQILSYLEV